MTVSMMFIGVTANRLLMYSFTQQMSGSLPNKPVHYYDEVCKLTSLQSFQRIVLLEYHQTLDVHWSLQ